MSRYGSNYYELAYYGSPNIAFYSALNFTARPEKFGYIALSWSSPAGNWSKIKLTRNSYGFPVNPWDGTELDISNDGTKYAFKETDPTMFDDKENIGYNAFYYYSLFVFQNNTNRWQRVGNSIGLSPGDYGYTDLMYDYLPEVYKVNSLNDPFAGTQNEDLYNFLSLFGFQLSLTHTYTHLLVNRYDIEKVGGGLVPALMQEFGLPHEPELGYQQERTLLQNATLIYKEKGSSGGLKEFLKAYSGYGISSTADVPNPPLDGFTVGKNILLDYNDSSFEEAIGHWKTPDASAVVYSLKESRVKKVSVTSNVATLVIGAHSYQTGTKVYTSGFSMPLFNKTTSAVTITSITPTSISFSLTNADIPLKNAFNQTTDAYPIVYPYPAAWAEPTSPALYPNKRKGILAVKNAKGTSGTVKLSCGKDNPITKGVPVTAGEVYSFSIYAVGDSTARNVTAGLDWYDRFGELISSSTGTATSDSTGQFTVRLTAANKTAPTGAYYAVPTLSIAASAASASNEWHYFDSAQLEQSSSVTSFEDARQLHITLKASRINELVNPHFKTSMMMTPDPWMVDGGTVDVMTNVAPPEVTVYDVAFLTLDAGIATLETVYTSDLRGGDSIYISGVSEITDGTYEVTEWHQATVSAKSYLKFDTGTSTTAARAVVTGTLFSAGHALMVLPTATEVTIESWDGSTTDQQMNIHYPGSEYTFSVYSQGASTEDTVTLFINWYDDTHTLISTDTGTTYTVVSLSDTNDWDRTYMTAVAPSTAAYATVGMSLTTSVGNMYHFDAALFEHQAFLLPVFSGEGGPGANTDFLWEGDADASRSHYYKNYEVMSSRLSGTALKDQLLLGTSLALYYAQPNT